MSELIYSLFVPERQNPLHDGAVVIQAGKPTVAGVFLPASVPKYDRGPGHVIELASSGWGNGRRGDYCFGERGNFVACDGELDMDVSPSALRYCWRICSS